MTGQGYQDFTVEVALRSSVVTPFQSDTIFGHICWAIEHLGMNGGVEAFLQLYDNTPPLLVSAGFPKGFVPRPVLRPGTRKELKEILDGGESRAANAHLIKTIKKRELISRDSFAGLMQNAPLTPSKLLVALKKDEDNIKKRLIENTQLSHVQHNSINRLGRISDTGLYTQEETFFKGDAGKFEIYIKTNFFSLENIRDIFAFIGENGYGRDKSTGKGHFKVEGILEGILRDAVLPEVSAPNAFMTLSSYVPGADDPTIGYYNLIHKFGKLGGDFAGGSKIPFKKPLVMLAPGSVFFDEGFDKERFYGSLLSAVHGDDGIRHYAYAFPIGIRIDKEE
ncbi:MAG: hypothetical protein HYV24_06805 [Deltaproteobacteria bacterium]|nr:hypothetical protein [Deltaproteobacteria bacterium]